MEPTFVKMRIKVTAKLIEDGEVKAVYGEEIEVDPQELFLSDIAMALEKGQNLLQTLVRLANLGSKSPAK